MAAIGIPGALRAALYAHALEEFPAECCGYLIGAGDAVTGIVRCHNAQATGAHPTHPGRGPEAGFVIAGAELLAFARSFRGASPARVLYHSHTDGRAYLSEIDRRNASTHDGPTYPVQHLVIGVTASGPTEVAQFAWREASRGFVEVARWDPRC